MSDKQIYKWSVCRIIATGGVSSIMGFVLWFSGIELEFLVNIPAMTTVSGLCFFLLLGSFGMDFLRFIPASLTCLACTPSRPDPRNAEIAKFGSRYVIAAGVIYAFMGVMSMLMYISDPSGLGMGLSKVLIGPFFAVLVSELFFAFAYATFSDSSSDPCCGDAAPREKADDNR